MNDPVKRHDLFLRMAARLLPCFPDLQFVLIGDGPLRPNLERLAQQLGIENRVTFLGDRRDVPAVLASLDISVMPSASESLSNVILESMAAGVPVVATRVGGNLELVQDGETGFMVPPGDDPSADEMRFAAAVGKLVTQPELRQKFGSNAREKAQHSYSVSKIRDCYQDLYQSLLAHKGWVAAPSAGQLRPVGTSPQGL
jgi:glycosyltransferase involved in cell wall biosynthesis